MARENNPLSLCRLWGEKVLEDWRAENGREEVGKVHYMVDKDFHQIVGDTTRGFVGDSRVFLTEEERHPSRKTKKTGGANTEKGHYPLIIHRTTGVEAENTWDANGERTQFIEVEIRDIEGMKNILRIDEMLRDELERSQRVDAYGNLLDQYSDRPRIWSRVRSYSIMV